MNRILFLHIPKTAGSSFHSIIDKQFQQNKILVVHPYMEKETTSFHITSTQEYVHETNQWIAKNHLKLKNFQLIKGHLSFKNIFLNEFKPITLLRNPIDRTISNYHHISKEWQNRYDSSFPEVKDYLNDLHDVSIDNLQVRFFVDKVDKDVILNSNDLALAKNYLDDIFDYGITEYFDESILLFKKKFGWKNVNYKRKNTGNYRKNNIDSFLNKKIMDHNEYDLEFYNYALKKFIREADKIPKIHLKLFRMRNSALFYKSSKADW